MLWCNTKDIVLLEYTWEYFLEHLEEKLTLFEYLFASMYSAISSNEGSSTETIKTEFM